MSGISTAMPTSYKGEMPRALHDHTTTTGHVFKMPLVKVSPTGTYGTGTTNYSDLTGNSDEVAAGSGYTTAGFAWTAAQNTTPATSSTTAYWSWSVNPSWTSATFSSIGCLIVNHSSSDRACYTGSFGGTVTVSAGTLTVLLPTDDLTNAILRIQ